MAFWIDYHKKAMKEQESDGLVLIKLFNSNYLRYVPYLELIFNSPFKICYIIHGPVNLSV